MLRGTDYSDQRTATYEVLPTRVGEPRVPSLPLSIRSTYKTPYWVRRLTLRAICQVDASAGAMESSRKKQRMDVPVGREHP